MSDYHKSKEFYTNILGLTILNETYREARQSYKLDLAIDDNYILELFSFPNYVVRPSFPEALGLRHLAFAIDKIDAIHHELQQQKIPVESIRIDELTGKRFFFFRDPDGLPLELYEV